MRHVAGERDDGIENLSIIPWEQEKEIGLRDVLRKMHPLMIGNSSMSVFIGPEGGFTHAEVEYAGVLGIIPVSLGPRILRAETAGLVTAAAILYELGELG